MPDVTNDVGKTAMTAFRLLFLLGSWCWSKLANLAAKEFLQHRCDLVGPEAAGAGATNVGELALGIDDIQAIRSTRVGVADFIIESVHQHRQRHLEIRDEVLRHLVPFFERPRVFDEDAVLDVLRCLPSIGGMGFTNVDEVEVNVFAVFLEQFLDLTDRVSERRSSTTAENQHHRLPFQIGKFHLVLAVRVGQLEHRSDITAFERSGLWL